MSRTLRPLSLGQLLDETFNLYRRNFLLFVGISAVPNIALLLLQLGLDLAGGSDAGTIAFSSSVGSLLSSIVIIPIVTAAATFAVSDLYLDNPTSIKACFSRLRGKVLRVVYVSFIFGLIVGLGAIFCLVPGIYLAGKYGLAIPAAVLENIPGHLSLNRSSELAGGSVGRVILVYFLTTIFSLLMVFAFVAGVDALGSSLFNNPGTIASDLLEEIISTIGAVLFGPVTAIGLTLLYYDQRVRKEAFDIERMMALMAGPEDRASAAQTGNSQ
jgi:hypothetical protein